MAFHSLFHHFFPLQIHDTILPRFAYSQHLRRNQKQVGDEFQQQFLNLTVGGILNRHGHFKYTLRAQRCRDCGR
jgi:hypothetical protein